MVDPEPDCVHAQPRHARDDDLDPLFAGDESSGPVVAGQLLPGGLGPPDTETETGLEDRRPVVRTTPNSRGNREKQLSNCDGQQKTSESIRPAVLQHAALVPLPAGFSDGAGDWNQARHGTAL